jgi:hypothetical protein
LNCPQGFYQRNAGSAECLPKTEGWILLKCNNQAGRDKGIECTDTAQCIVGTYQDDDKSKTQCLQCPIGFSSTNGATECQSCNKGEYGVLANNSQGKTLGLCNDCGKFAMLCGAVYHGFV